MKKFPVNKRATAPAEEEKITDALLGTGEHMCTCAALVADIIIEQGQEKVSLQELLAKMEGEGDGADSPAEKIP